MIQSVRQWCGINNHASEGVAMPTWRRTDADVLPAKELPVPLEDGSGIGGQLPQKIGWG